MKIVILEASSVSAGDVSYEPVHKLGSVTEYPLTPLDKIIENVGDAEAVLCNKTPFTEEILKSCPNLKYIGVCATGYNNIDIKAAKELGITVCNSPAYSTSAVAQQVFAYILHFANKVSEYNDFVSDGGWIKSPSFACIEFPLQELSGKTLGIIGYGAIGKKVARIALAFGMKILVHTRTPQNDSSIAFTDIKTLFSESDFITVHCPLTKDTDKLINLNMLRLCKPSAVLINTSRGAVVNEVDLAFALNNNIISGAALDVLCSEPMSAECPLYGVKNCVITPHVAWAPFETRQRLVNIVADNLKAFIDGKPVNVVS